MPIATGLALPGAIAVSPKRRALLVPDAEAVRLLDIRVFFAANSANVERAPEMLVRGVFFDDFRAFFRSRFDRDGRLGGRLDFGNGNDGFGYGFDDFLVFLAPEDGGCARPGSAAP